jgi:hypothetical protein
LSVFSLLMKGAVIYVVIWESPFDPLGNRLLARLIIAFCFVALLIIWWMRRRLQRMAIVVGETELTIQGRYRSKTIPFTEISSTCVGYDGKLYLALYGHTWQDDLREYVEPEDREEFVALVGPRTRAPH